LGHRLEFFIGPVQNFCHASAITVSSTIATFCWQMRRKWSLTGCNGYTECCSSCGLQLVQYTQVRPRFVAAPAVRASLARCAGKSSVQTRRRYVQLLARPITAVPRRSLCTNVRRLSTAASSIRYSAFFGGSAMLAQHTRSRGLLCGQSIALELSTRQLDRSGSWQEQLHTSAEDAFIYTLQKHLPY